MAANQSIADSVQTSLIFDGPEDFDTENEHDPAVNPSRLIAASAGTRFIVGGAQFAANATGYRTLIIRLNGATNLAVVQVPAVTTAATETALCVSAIYNFASGDFVEIQVVQNSGAALNVLVSTLTFGSMGMFAN